MAAAGDLLLTAAPGGATPGRGMEVISDEVRELFASCDVVFANLECTMPGKQTVPLEPRVISTETQMRSLCQSGIDVLTLGNNHTFDAMHEGFARTRDLLTEMNIRWCGAGDDITEAFQPAIVECKGITLAFLGTVDGSSGMHRFASQSESGVAPNDTETVCEVIKALRGEVDFIIISPHWGKERFRVPSPGQIEQAHAFVDAGAAMVLGHHPHVLQGMEIYRGAPIAYSLGNFIPGNVYWDDGDILTWNRFERTGCISIMELSREGIRMVRQIPVMDDGNSIRIETSGWGDHCLKQVNQLLTRGVTERRYRSEAFRVLKLMPILSHLRWSELRKMRFRHFQKGLQSFLTR